MRANTYAIVGAGALGGFYGAMLHRAGRAVHFLLHSDFDHVRRAGLRVDSKLHGDLSIAQPNIYSRPQDMPRCDVVLVALKSTANDLFPAILPHLVADAGAVLVMQNGLGIDEQAAAVVGPDRVVGGLAFLCSNKLGPGHIAHLDYGQVRLGEYSADGNPRGITPRLQSIAADFRESAVAVELEADLLAARWKKLVWNVPYNGLTVVLDATTDQLMANPSTRDLCEALMREVLAGAAACGRHIDESFVQQMLDHTRKMVPYKPSMKLDYDSRRAIEVEAIYGNPLRASRAAGTDLPAIAALYEQLKVLDARNRA